MSSTTSRASFYKPASGENVNVVTDLNNNWDAVDLNLNFRSCTSSTRPSTQWDGLCIHETDTNRQYVWNSSPATSGWYEVYGAGGTISQLNLAGSASGNFTLTSKITGNANPKWELRADGLQAWGDGTAAVDTYLYRTAANSLKTDGAFTSVGNVTVSSTTESTAVNVSGGGTFAKSLTVGGSASLGGGTGVLNLRNAATAPTAADSAGLNLYSEAGQLKSYTPSGNIMRLNGALGLSATVTRASVATEQDLVNVTIPANDAVTGAVYRLKAFGHASVTGTPTITFRGYIGTSQVGSTIAITASSGIQLHNWNAEIDLVYLGSNNWFGSLIMMEAISVSGSPPTSTSTLRTDGGGQVSATATNALAFKFTQQWSVSNAANTITCRGYTVERVA